MRRLSILLCDMTSYTHPPYVFRPGVLDEFLILKLVSAHVHHHRRFNAVARKVEHHLGSDHTWQRALFLLDRLLYANSRVVSYNLGNCGQYCILGLAQPIRVQDQPGRLVEVQFYISRLHLRNTR